MLSSTTTLIFTMRIDFLRRLHSVRILFKDQWTLAVSGNYKNNVITNNTMTLHFC